MVQLQQLEYIFLFVRDSEFNQYESEDRPGYGLKRNKGWIGT